MNCILISIFLIFQGLTSYIHYENPATPVVIAIVAAMIFSGIVLIIKTKIDIYREKHPKR